MFVPFTYLFVSWLIHSFSKCPHFAKSVIKNSCAVICVLRALLVLESGEWGDQICVFKSCLWLQGLLDEGRGRDEVESWRQRRDGGLGREWTCRDEVNRFEHWKARWLA
jgi:hypothetical protein